jgi:hypothetical protein
LGWGLGGFLDVRGALLPEARPVNATSTQITLDLDLDGDTISGDAIDAGGHRHKFFGWIGLMGVLDALLDRASSEKDNKDPRNGDQPC